MFVSNLVGVSQMIMYVGKNDKLKNYIWWTNWQVNFIYKCYSNYTYDHLILYTSKHIINVQMNISTKYVGKVMSSSI